MAIRVGIPQALLAYNYLPLWQTFLSELGAEVVTSGQTNSRIMNLGVRATVDEACLPVKLYHGHVLELRDQVDLLFLPRLVSLEKKAYVCPKLMGLPDMIQQCIEGLPPIIDVCFDLRRKANLRKPFWEIGQYFTTNQRSIARAFAQAVAQQNIYEGMLRSGLTPEAAWQGLRSGQAGRPPELPPLTIALLGHPYNLYDDYFNQRLITKLTQAGARVITPEMLSPDIICRGLQHLHKDLFWTLGRRVLGAAAHFLGQGQVDGIIHLAAFGCGPDSLVGELVELQAKRQDRVPFMLITLDEHTGEAGMETRLEAFLDMIVFRREAVESNLSPHGNSVCGH